MNKYLNLDFCLNRLHQFINDRPSADNCVFFRRIIPRNIGLENIKMPDNFNKDHVFNNNVKYAGKSGKHYYFKRKSSVSHPCTLRIGSYKGSRVDNMESGELVDMKMMYLFSEMVLDGNMKFILLPVFNFDVSRNDIKRLGDEFKPLLAERADKFYVNVTEHFHKIQTLKQFIKDNHSSFDNNKWTILFFQVLYALFKIQEKYPRFRHNELDLRSIFVYKRKNSSGSNIFTVKGKKFVVPNSEFEIRIGKFYKSTITGIISNSDTRCTKDNRYYDVHYFFHNVFEHMRKNGGVPSYFRTFFDTVVPENTRVPENQKYTGLDEELFEQSSKHILDPMLILTKNNIFSQFIKEQMDISSSSVSNSPRDLRSYNKKDNSVGYVQSLTDLSTERPLMLGRKVKKNTKKRGGGKRTVVKGSRKLHRANQDVLSVSSDSSASGGALTPSPVSITSYDFSDSALNKNTSNTANSPKSVSSASISSFKNVTADNGFANESSASNDRKVVNDILAMSQFSALSESAPDAGNTEKNAGSNFLELFKGMNPKNNDQGIMSSARSQRSNAPLPTISPEESSQMGGSSSEYKRSSRDKRSKRSKRNLTVNTQAGQTSVLSDEVQNNVMSKLPEGFSGPVPDHFNLPNPQQLLAQRSNQGGISGLPGLPPMTPPNAGMGNLGIGNLGMGNLGMGNQLSSAGSLLSATSDGTVDSAYALSPTSAGSMEGSLANSIASSLGSFSPSTAGTGYNFSAMSDDGSVSVESAGLGNGMQGNPMAQLMGGPGMGGPGMDMGGMSHLGPAAAGMGGMGHGGMSHLGPVASGMPNIPIGGPGMGGPMGGPGMGGMGGLPMLPQIGQNGGPQMPQMPNMNQPVFHYGGGYEGNQDFC